MKTKKISWQAIAIVVLALVLIASIALGVSGAWFQDSDSASTEATLGKAVTIRLKDTADNSKDPIGWETLYKTSTSAYPGDTLLQSVSIVPGSDTPSVFRIKIVASASGTGYVADQSEPAEAGTAANDSYLINQMLDLVELTGWSKGSSDWYYYDEINKTETAIKLFDKLTLSNELSNAAAEWEISVTINVEAIQAANITADGAAGNADWRDDMPSALKGKIVEYNGSGDNGRLN